MKNLLFKTTIYALTFLYVLSCALSITTIVLFGFLLVEVDPLKTLIDWVYYILPTFIILQSMIYFGGKLNDSSNPLNNGQ